MSRDLPEQPNLDHLKKQNTIRADGREHPADHGYVLLATWSAARILEVVVKKGGDQMSRVMYEVSADRTTLLLSAASSAHGGYPATERVRVFDRA